MSRPLSIEELRQLKGIMHSMLIEAQNANWQELTRLDSERRVLIGYKEHSRFTPLQAIDETSQDVQPLSRIHSAPVNGTLNRSRSIPLPETPRAASGNSLKPAPDKEYIALSRELTALDKEINKTVLDARHALLEQTRVLRAQVSAKKGYEQANTMKISSYS